MKRETCLLALYSHCSVDRPWLLSPPEGEVLLDGLPLLETEQVHAAGRRLFEPVDGAGQDGVELGVHGHGVGAGVVNDQEIALRHCRERDVLG